MGLLLATALPVFNSCAEQEDLFVPDVSELQTAAITISMPGANVITRATDPGVPTLNENKVETIDLFLYPTNRTEEEAKVHLTIPKSKITAADMTTEGEVVNSFTVNLSKSTLRQLFANFETGTNLTCEAFAIINLPSSIKATNPDNEVLLAALEGYTNEAITSTKMSDLKKLALSCSDFSLTESIDNSSHYKCKTPLYFVMSGENSLSLDTYKRNLTGNIDVYRSAAKVSVKLTNVAETAKTYQEQSDGTTLVTTWESELDHITVRMRNGQDKGFVEDATMHATTGYFDKKNILLKNDGTVEVVVDDETNETETHHQFSTEIPLYTYPNNWSSDATHRTSLTICINWKKVGTNKYEPTYYEIPIDDQKQKLLRNTHYVIQLKIGVVGSFIEEEPYLLDNCSYTILPWGENLVTQAMMSQVRYLVVNQREAVMNNIIALPIAYSSSHNIDKYSMKLEARDLRNSNAIWTEITDFGSNDHNEEWNTSNFRVVLPSDNEGSNIGNKQVVVEHDLVNNGDEKSHYTAFRMTFTLQHSTGDATADAKYKETVVVIQYPMVYADAERHSLYPSDGNTYNFVNGTNGYERNGTTNNASTGSGATSRYLGGNHGLTGTNTNPNRYIINATSLKDDKFIIGDPRTSWVNNELTTINISDSRPNAYGWSYAFNNSTSLTTAQSWSRYSEEVYSSGSHYGSYSEYLAAQAAGLNPTRDLDSQAWEYTWYGAPNNWTNYTSEATACEGNNGYYFWRERTGTDWWGPTYTYYRARYSIPNTATRYVNTIKYYHPAEESDRTVNMIAPSFMVASSYGVCTTGINKEKARRRCASYQEDGYPAGRWRLPTSAEVLYICQLTAWGKIPMLFGSASGNSYYWTANGVVRVNPSQGQAELLDDSNVTESSSNYYSVASYVGNQGISVRCVYDSWYWTDTCTKNTFTWGDKEDSSYWGSQN